VWIKKKKRAYPFIVTDNKNDVGWDAIVPKAPSSLVKHNMIWSPRVQLFLDIKKK
jgi:hypothetical protein